MKCLKPGSVSSGGQMLSTRLSVAEPRSTVSYKWSVSWYTMSSPWLRAHLDVSGLVRPFTLLVSADVCDVLLTDITIPAIRVCLCRALRLHLVLERKLEEFLGLRYCQQCVGLDPCGEESWLLVLPTISNSLWTSSSGILWFVIFTQP